MEKNYGWNSPNICFISFPESSERETERERDRDRDRERETERETERESGNAKEKTKTISSCTLFFLCFSFLR